MLCTTYLREREPTEMMKQPVKPVVIISRVTWFLRNREERLSHALFLVGFVLKLRVQLRMRLFFVALSWKILKFGRILR